jgi:hypothetical protein
MLLAGTLPYKYLQFYRILSSTMSLSRRASLWTLEGVTKAMRPKTAT